eukprot:TRINITY_DN20051_c0_g1_i1.p1 TRINITY_DN20051_c0_g1~~TRINITY_DN20051_c0_g1_i1.p1  ORF type:complete len:234 (+),score=30.64 TRINITY_DN20051_c0_g1_i1:74-775(+)
MTDPDGSYDKRTCDHCGVQSWVRVVDLSSLPTLCRRCKGSRRDASRSPQPGSPGSGTPVHAQTISPSLAAELQSRELTESDLQLLSRLTAEPSFSADTNTPEMTGSDLHGSAGYVAPAPAPEASTSRGRGASFMQAPQMQSDAGGWRRTAGGAWRRTDGKHGVLDESAFAQLAAPTAGDWDAKDCPICLEPMQSASDVRCLPRCGHGFHTGCIRLWVCTRQAVCPLDKLEVVV